MRTIADTTRWSRARRAAIRRDGGRCTVSRLLGGTCAAGPLHVHHIHAVSEGGDRYDLDNLGTVCASHHPSWESLRRILVQRMMEPQVRCTHRHVSAEARRICEQRMARQVARREKIPA